MDHYKTALQRAYREHGVKVASSFSRGAYDKVGRAKLEQELEIELKL